jgi:hypothetical protein
LPVAPVTVRVVDRLVEQRLVRAGRGLAVALRVTAAGRRQARRVLVLRQQVLAYALPDLSPEESNALRAILEKGLAHLASSPRTTILPPVRSGTLPQGRLPVARRQVELGAPPPEPVPLDR